MCSYEPGRMVLVAEDQAIIGMFVADGLVDEGFRIAGPFQTCSDALAWLAINTPDAAILDVRLRDGPCYELANALDARKVPYFIFSGDPPTALDHQRLGHVEWVEKPGGVTKLLRALDRLSYHPVAVKRSLPLCTPAPLVGPVT